MRPGRLDAAGPIETRQPLFVRPMIDPAGSVALHIGMPPNRAGSRAFPAKVAAHQQHIHNLPNSVHCVLLLGDPKALSDVHPISSVTVWAAKKRASNAFGCHLPDCVLEAVFTNIHPQPLAVIGPGAARAIEAAVLVIHLENHTRALEQFVLFEQHL
jgi:hypothetical protein